MFIPFMFGIYPMTNAAAGQRDAVKRAEIGFEQKSAYERIYDFLWKLFN